MRTFLVTALASAAVFTAALGAADEPAFTVRPVMVVSCAPIPDVPFEAKPFNYNPGFKITYIIEGQDLVGLKDDSLTIETMATADGKDVSVTRTGKPTWKMGAFPKVSDDGNDGFFTIECEQGQFGKVESMNVAGHITVLTGTKRGTKSGDLAVAAKDPVVIGPFKASIGGGGAAGMFGAMMGKGDKESFGITISGELSSLISCTVTAAGAKLEDGGWSGGGDQRTYNFDKPAATTVTVNLSWWEDRVEHVVAFTQGKPAK